MAFSGAAPNERPESVNVTLQMIKLFAYPFTICYKTFHLVRPLEKRRTDQVFELAWPGPGYDALALLFPSRFPGSWLDQPPSPVLIQSTLYIHAYFILPTQHRFRYHVEGEVLSYHFPSKHLDSSLTTPCRAQINARHRMGKGVRATTELPPVPRETSAKAGPVRGKQATARKRRLHQEDS